MHVREGARMHMRVRGYACMCAWGGTHAYAREGARMHMRGWRQGCICVRSKGAATDFACDDDRACMCIEQRGGAVGGEGRST